MKKDDFKIDFIGIGAQKSATSWVFNCLKEHPEICGSSTKEPFFFNRSYNYEKGLDFYKTFFEDCSQDKIKGEFTSTYYFQKGNQNNISQRIYKHFPEVKLIASLRNPIERAYSHYRYGKRKGGQFSKYDSFEKAIEEKPPLLEKGLYYKQLTSYFELFPRENILVIILKDIKEKPEAVARELYEFLGAEPFGYEPSCLNKKSNPTKETKVSFKFPPVQHFWWWGWELIGKRDKHPKINSLLQKTGLKGLMRRLKEINKSVEETEEVSSTSVDGLDKNTREKLKRYYAEDIEKLEGLINKDLSHWK